MNPGTNEVAWQLSGRVFEITRCADIVQKWNKPSSRTSRGIQTAFMPWREHRCSPGHRALRGRMLGPAAHVAPNLMHGLAP